MAVLLRFRRARACVGKGGGWRGGRGGREMISEATKENVKMKTMTIILQCPYLTKAHQPPVIVVEVKSAAAPVVAIAAGRIPHPFAYPRGG